MIWEVAGAMPLYVKLAVVLVVVLVGGYWIAQEVMAARCGCRCCLLECLDCIRGDEDKSHQDNPNQPL